MATIFFMFSLTLCLASSVTSPDHFVPERVLPLSAQFVTVQRQLFSHCPEIFRYAFNGKEWHGLLVIARPAPKGVPSRLKVLLSIGFYLSSVSRSVALPPKDRVSTNDIALCNPDSNKFKLYYSLMSDKSNWRKTRTLQWPIFNEGCHWFIGSSFRSRTRYPNLQPFITTTS